MNPLAGWTLVPIVLLVLCAGIGLLADRLSGARLPGALLPAAGLAGLIVLAGLPALLDATAELAVPLVAVAAVAGLVLGRPWSDPRLRAAWPWPLLAGFAAFALFAAPSVLSGQGSIAGYVKLDDAATWFALIDHVLERGRDVSGLPPSTFRATLGSWLAGGYPVGAFFPFASAAQLSGQDVANAFQPAIATTAAILAVTLYAIAREIVDSRPAAAAAGFCGTQASLFVGYAQWGGVKEVTSATLIATLIALAARARVGGTDGIRVLALAVLAGGALLGTLGVPAVVWVGPALLLGALLVLVPRATRPPVRVIGVATAGLLALLAGSGLPALRDIEFLRQATVSTGGIAAQDDFGNLFEALPVLQAGGLYPVGDLRADPDPRAAAVLLALACLLAAAVAAAVAVARRRWALPALLGLGVAGTALAVSRGSPWIDAKALTILSPFILAGAATLVALGLTHRREAARLGATVGGVALLFGLGWSTWVIAREVQVAPRALLAEFHEVADVIGEDGPALILDFEPYADRHFLRRADAEGASDLRVRPVLRRDGQQFARLTSAEVDEVATPDLWVYRTIVRRRTPAGSRPPTGFERVYAGELLEAWQRPADARPPLARLPLGSAVSSSGPAVCSQVRDLSRTPGIRTLAAVPRDPAVSIAFAGNPGVPAGWNLPEGTVSPLTDGTAVLRTTVAEEGRWRLWLGGAVRGTVEVEVDGRPAGTLRHDLAYTGQWQRLDAVRLSAGEHTITVRYDSGVRPGRGQPATRFPIGPLALSPPGDDAEPPAIREVAPEDFRELCGAQSYDWIEARP